MNGNYIFSAFSDGIYSTSATSPSEPSELKKIKSTVHLGKALKTNPEQTHLIFNTLNQGLLVMKISDSGLIEGEVKIEIQEQGHICDFLCIDTGLVIVTTSKGSIGVYSYEFPSSSKKICSIENIVDESLKECPVSLCSVDGNRKKFVIHTFFKKDSKRYAYSLKLFNLDMSQQKIEAQGSILLNHTDRDIEEKSDLLAQLETISSRKVDEENSVLFGLSFHNVTTAAFFHVNFKNGVISELDKERKNLEKFEFGKKICLVEGEFVCCDQNLRMVRVKV